MTGKTHMVTGALFAVGFAAATDQADAQTALLGTATAVFASLIPDLDCTEAKLSRTLLFTVPSHIICGLTEHRGIMHSVFGLAGMTFIWYLLMSLLPFDAMATVPYFALGYLSHLVADSFTKGGVGWLHPLVKKKISVMPIITNSPTEMLFALPVAAATVILSLEYFPGLF